MRLKEPYEDELELLTSDFFKASIGRFIIDVSWQPERDLNGFFHCRVILDNNWSSPLEELKTKNGDEMMFWAKKQMREAHKRTPPTKKDT